MSPKKQPLFHGNVVYFHFCLFPSFLSLPHQAAITTDSAYAVWSARMSESPASRTAMVEQRNILPQAVPSSIYNSGGSGLVIRIEPSKVELTSSQGKPRHRTGPSFWGRQRRTRAVVVIADRTACTVDQVPVRIRSNGSDQTRPDRQIGQSALHNDRSRQDRSDAEHTPNRLVRLGHLLEVDSKSQ